LTCHKVFSCILLYCILSGNVVEGNHKTELCGRCREAWLKRHPGHIEEESPCPVFPGGSHHLCNTSLNLTAPGQIDRLLAHRMIHQHALVLKTSGGSKPKGSILPPLRQIHGGQL